MKNIRRITCLFAALGLFYGMPVLCPGPASAASEAAASKVEIFVTSWCPYCRKLESFLKGKNIPYTRYDVEADAKGAEIFDKIGGTGVPVIRVGDEVIHGYDPDRVLAALKERA